MPDDVELTRIRGRLAEALGGGVYNRLVASVPDVWKRGRLRYWQEQRLRGAGALITTAEEFIRVFDGATPICVPPDAPGDGSPNPSPPGPWTRALFLRRIEEFPHGDFPLDETPPEWMAAAWEIERVRNELSTEMARTVGKTGDLAYSDEWLHYLSRSLPVPRQVELFLHIRDGRIQHREFEFRLGFERAFPAAVPHLPPALTVKQLSEMLGITEDEYSRRQHPAPLPSWMPGAGQFGVDDIPF